jgi:hypothetical protein
MKKIILTLFISVLFISSIFSQIGVNLKKYDFREIPVVTADEDKQYEKEGSLILRQCQILDYHPDDAGKSIDLWYCNHITVKIYNDDELNSFKKVSVGKDLSNLVSWGARSVGKDGKITVYGDQDIKDIEEEDEDEDGKKVNYKALVPYALEKGDILEYYFITKKPFYSNGGYYIQSDYTKMNYEFTIAFPSHMEAEVISYNGAPNAIDTIVKSDERRFYYISSKLIPASPKENVAFYKANLQQLQYVVSYNYAYSRNVRLNTIDSYAQNVYNNIVGVDKSALKAIKKLGGSIKIIKEMSTEDKIRTIENYMKDNFYILNYNSDELSDVKSVVESKITNMVGILRIYYALFDQFGINNELAITSDKTELRFDKNLNASNFLDEILFYFPDIDQYIAPRYYAYRLGLTPSFLSNTDAVFLSKVTIGNISNFMADIKQIPGLPMEATGDSLKLDVKVDINNKVLTGKLRRALSGYIGFGLQANVKGSEAEEKEYLIQQYIGLGSENTNVSNEKFYNDTVVDVFLKPMIMTADISSYEYIRFNEDEIIVNVGKLIGEQSRLEQKEARTQPVDLAYLRHFYRFITVEIPEGYRVKNLQDLNIAVYDTDNPASAKAGFVSTAKQENNKIVIECTEYYNKFHYPVNEFVNYRKVVNAAADFNDIRLYFSK